METTSLTFSTSREVMTEQSHKGVWASLAEMQRVRGRIVAIREPMQWIKNLGWAALALAPAAILAWLPWIAAYDALPDAAKLQFAWVGPAMLLVALFSLILAFVCFFMNRSRQSEITHDKQSALDVLDAIAERYGLTEGFGEDSSIR
jgi:hypothetical protein